MISERQAAAGGIVYFILGVANFFFPHAPKDADLQKLGSVTGPHAHRTGVEEAVKITAYLTKHHDAAMWVALITAFSALFLLLFATSLWYVLRRVDGSWMLAGLSRAGATA